MPTLETFIDNLTAADVVSLTQHVFETLPNVGRREEIMAEDPGYKRCLEAKLECIVAAMYRAGRPAESLQLAAYCQVHRLYDDSIQFLNWRTLRHGNEIHIRDLLFLRERRIYSHSRDRAPELQDVPTYWDLASAVRHLQPMWTETQLRVCKGGDSAPTWNFKERECFHEINLANYDRLVKGACCEIRAKLVLLFCGKSSRMPQELFDEILKFCLVAEGIGDEKGARAAVWLPVPTGQVGTSVGERDGKYMGHRTREDHRCAWMKEEERRDEERRLFVTGAPVVDLESHSPF